MTYTCLEDSLRDLEKIGQLIRVKEEVDPYLEMAAIHLRVHEMNGPAILFEKVKGSPYRACSNIFGTTERCDYLFRHTIPHIETILQWKKMPLSFFHHFFNNLSLLYNLHYAFPIKKGNQLLKNKFDEITIHQLPLIHHWEKDGGAFVTLPQVYSEDIEQKGWKHANIGMYRIQLTGNQYTPNKEVGLHYQLHRGIGIHQSKALQKKIPLPVSCFIGGPPSHTIAAIMPLPENISELYIAGWLGQRQFRYLYEDAHFISLDADFIITGEINDETKLEGPFGDHLGYYSLQHLFPVMKIKKVYAKRNAIWPFTVVGRPPQEDTQFGKLIHHITQKIIPTIIPGIKEIHAVDAAGVHPLLFAIGSERYTPYDPIQTPSELLTQANRILGTGQLSLAKFLWIVNKQDDTPSIQRADLFIPYLLERIDFKNDLHFYTHTSIDTLDYSGEAFLKGSKLVLAAVGDKKRILAQLAPTNWDSFQLIKGWALLLPGVLAIQFPSFVDMVSAEKEITSFFSYIKDKNITHSSIAMVVICDDIHFIQHSLHNFLWVCFTRSNPSHDIYGYQSSTTYKHWGCEAPLVFDARIKPHHAPILEKNITIEKRVDALFENGRSLSALNKYKST